MKKVSLLFVEVFLIVLTLLGVNTKEEFVAALASDGTISSNISTFSSNGGISTNDTYASSLWGLDMIDIEDAWGISIGSSSVKVGIIDSGIDYDHEDLYGQVNTTLSKNFLSRDSDPLEPKNNSHGTFIAGIIGALVNNNKGVAGVCQNVDMVSFLITETGRAYNSEDIVAAIEYAGDNDIKILNMSLYYPSFSENIYNAIKNYDGLVICCAGNDGSNITQGGAYPAAYDLDNIITVGGVDSSGNKVSNSNYSSTVVDVMAPGIDIMSTSLDNEYVSFQGTSYATAYVTGIAALLKSYNQSLTPSQIKTYILNSVVSYSGLSNYCSTGGVVNAYNALNAARSAHNHSYVYQYAGPEGQF